MHCTLCGLELGDELLYSTASRTGPVCLECHLRAAESPELEARAGGQRPLARPARGRARGELHQARARPLPLGGALAARRADAGCRRGRLGKSTLLAEQHARLSRGELAGECYGRPTASLIITSEDHAASVIRPRLQAAGADLDRAHVVTIEEDGVGGLVTFPDDLPMVEQAIGEYGAPAHDRPGRGRDLGRDRLAQGSLDPARAGALGPGRRAQ